MSPAAQKRKLQLIERINGLTDLRQIKAVEDLLSTSQHFIVPQDEADIVRVGRKQIQNGEVFTLEQVMDSMDEAIIDGAALHARHHAKAA
jgi:hypothetical protein